MFSVEDLLVSHGYTVSKTSVSSCEHRSEENQHETTVRTGNGTLNGYQTDLEIFGPDPNPLAKSFFSDNEKSYVNKRRQIHSAGYPRNQQCVDACHTSEAGLSDRPPIERSQRTKTDKDIAYWRRRGQDFTVLLGHGDNGAAGDKGIFSTDIEAKKKYNVIDKNAEEGQREEVESMENVRSNAVYENWRPSLEKQWENVDRNVMKNPNTFERKVSPGSGENVPQDLISFPLGDHAVECPNKRKPQSLPKVISPESTRHGNIPTIRGENDFQKENTTLSSHNMYVVNVDCNRNSFSKPKYIRPSKPPSYELHQQTWGATEVNDSQDNQQQDEQLSVLRVQDPTQECCIQDSGLEPPIYIPPPSYKSPPLQHATNQSFNKVPSNNDYNCQNEQVEKTSTSDKRPPTIFQRNNFPYIKPANQRHTDNCTHSVQYIPFDDPRIRHITIAHNSDKHDHNTKLNNMDDTCRVGYTSQECNLQPLKIDSAFSDLKSVGRKRDNIKSKRWLNISIPDRICCALPDQRGGSTASSLPDNNENTHRLSLKKTQSDGACETVTKVKKFEPESCVLSKKSSKRKLNETIFCLVSIPVKSDSAPSNMHQNNNDFTERMDRINKLRHSSGVLHEQRLLHASSSDLELQTLTGNMNNKAELAKQEQSKTEENKQANDLRCFEPRKYGELTYSGSWPGDQYKDQQTQTIYTDTHKLPFYNGTKTSQLHNKLTIFQCVSASEPAESRLPSKNVRQNMYSIKGQMNLSPSSNSAFSRTSLLLTHISKTEPSQRQCNEISNENAEDRGKSTVSNCERNEIEAENPCNKKEVFGQFLLKPVNRRPWDAISELESLNKEFQEQENAVNDGDRNVTREQSKCSQIGNGTKRTAIENEMVNNNHHVIEIQEVPMFEPRRVKCKSESWCTEKLASDKKEIGVKLKHSVKMKDSRSKSGKLSAGCVKTDIQIRNKKSGNATSINAIITPNMDQKESALQTYTTKVHTNKIKLPVDASFRNFRDNKTYFDHTSLDVVKLNKMNTGNVGQFGETAIRKLSLTDRSHGLSVPDLSKHFAGTNNNGALYEQHIGLEIPENESLHERAARILGIEVADDCLVNSETSEAQIPQEFTSSVSGKNLHFKSETCDLENISFSTKEICSGILHFDLNAERALEMLKKIKQGQEQSLTDQSASQHSETDIAKSVEKKVRNTSKMIETLQGKLASTPARTAVDRLARMKEVDSVSRMRRLSIKSTDSGDEVDEEKQLYRGQDVGSRKFSAGAVYKRVISLDESLLLSTKSRKKLDLSCSDAYDPARVERV
ncbi:hypothetical protein FKM82_007133 [Ascaphus truei]